jgi:uncharacterized OsmC-like protein
VATDALIDAQRLKLGVLQTTARLETNPDGGIIRPSVETHLVRDVSVEARFEQHGREFVFRSDEPTGRGGHAAGPTAIRYFLSGIAFCLQVWYAKGAALVGCELNGLTLELETILDMRREYALPPTGVPERLIAQIVADSPSPPALVGAMVDEAHRRCPLSNLVAVSLPLYVRLEHNGVVIRDTVPRA